MVRLAYRLMVQRIGEEAVVAFVRDAMVDDGCRSDAAHLLAQLA